MATIHVEKPFTLTQDTGQRVSFPVGRHEVPDHVADHWYVKPHCKQPTGVGSDPVARLKTPDDQDQEPRGKDAKGDRPSRGR